MKWKIGVLRPLSIQCCNYLHHNFVETLHQLLRRTLVLVAHPDDEAIGCGLLLQQMHDPIVVFATDGAPRSDYFWKAHGSRENYASIRAREARNALSAVGVSHIHLLSDDNPIVDQELFRHLARAYKALAVFIEQEIPDALLTLAYEGGHPDHDACSFLAFMAAADFDLPVWEMPLYHFFEGKPIRQAFCEGGGIRVRGSEDQIARKRKMVAEYSSQGLVLADFPPENELVRPMIKYDFSKPPHEGMLNYENWQWPMKGSDICQAFQQFSQHSAEQRKEHACGNRI